MIKDVVVHNGLLRIATGTFVCMVGHSSRGQARSCSQSEWAVTQEPIHFLTAVSLSLGALVLLDAGLYSAASSRYPSGGGIGAIIGPCIERNRRAWDAGSEAYQARHREQLARRRAPSLRACRATPVSRRAKSRRDPEPRRSRRGVSLRLRSG